MTTRHALWLGLSIVIVVAFSAVVHAEPLPIIVTYELSKARREARAAQRDPKTFWAGAIVAWIEGRKPDLDMHLKVQRTVNVAFVVGRDGRLISSTVEKSSGDPVVDKQAVAMLARAAPFPPMPAGLDEEQMSFALPLRFK